MHILPVETISANSLIALAATVLVAAWTDWTTWRIPNWLIAGSAAAAVMLAAFAPDGIGFANCLLGGVIGFAVFLPLYLMKGTAAGDVKLMAAIGMHVGPWAVVDIALLTCLIGGVWAMFAIAANKEFGLLSWLALQWRSRFARRTASQATAKRSVPEQTDSRQMIPYGVVIALGTFVALW